MRPPRTTTPDPAGIGQIVQPGEDLWLIERAGLELHFNGQFQPANDRELLLRDRAAVRCETSLNRAKPLIGHERGNSRCLDFAPAIIAMRQRDNHAGASAGIPHVSAKRGEHEAGNPSAEVFAVFGGTGNHATRSATSSERELNMPSARPSSGQCFPSWHCPCMVKSATLPRRSLTNPLNSFEISITPASM